jgi:hypothetical protein
MVSSNGPAEVPGGYSGQAYAPLLHLRRAGVAGGRSPTAGGSRRAQRTSHHHEEERRAIANTLVIVEVRVPGVRVLLDVIVQAERRQGPVELLGGPPIGPSLAP